MKSTCFRYASLAVATLIALALGATDTFAQDFELSGTTDEVVAKLKGKYRVSDTIMETVFDAERNQIEVIRQLVFCDYKLNDLSGLLNCLFESGKLNSVRWTRCERDELFGDLVLDPEPGSPVDQYLDEIHSDCKRKHLEPIAERLASRDGKIDLEQRESSLRYVWPENENWAILRTGGLFVRWSVKPSSMAKPSRKLRTW